MTNRPKPPAPTFVSEFHNNFLSKIPAPVYRNMDILHHVLATLVLVLQEEHPLIAAVYISGQFL